MHDKYKRRFQAPKGTDRVRRQIAVEAARRMFELIVPAADDPQGRLKDATEAEYYTAKRKAAAVLGHRVRPGDLPSDAEVREEVVTLSRSKAAQNATDQPEPADGGEVAALADHLDRFAVYAMRLAPLESVKQSPKTHPEGDALYHSLQVFELARRVRPYDEEFLLAALLHDVGKGVDSADHSAAAVESLRGSVTGRTLWLIEHHMDLLRDRDKTSANRRRTALGAPELLDDLELLRSLDDAGRVAGLPVETLEEVLSYLQSLDREDFLRDES
jgi:HD domain